MKLYVKVEADLEQLRPATALSINVSGMTVGLPATISVSIAWSTAFWLTLMNGLEYTPNLAQIPGQITFLFAFIVISYMMIMRGIRGERPD